MPELWIAVAENPGIKQIPLTTRDVLDYDVIMKGRLKILAEHGLRQTPGMDHVSGVKITDGLLKVVLRGRRGVAHRLILVRVHE